MILIVTLFLFKFLFQARSISWSVENDFWPVKLEIFLPDKIAFKSGSPAVPVNSFELWEKELSFHTGMWCFFNSVLYYVKCSAKATSSTTPQPHSCTKPLLYRKSEATIVWQGHCSLHCTKWAGYQTLICSPVDRTITLHYQL